MGGREAVAAEPGVGMWNREKGQTVRAQRVFVPPVSHSGDRGSLSGMAAVFFGPFFWASKKKDAPPAGD